MKSQIWLLILVCLGCTAAMAAPCPTSNSPYNFCLTGTGSSAVLDGIYISPYTATVNGVSTAVICDDFYDEVIVPEDWQVTSGTIGSNTTGYFGSESSSQYAQVAWLSEQLLSNPSNAGALSYAIWAVFDAGDVQTWLSGYHDTTTLNAVFGANGLLSQSLSYTSGNYSNVTVYTPVAGGANSCPSCGPPQEFVVVATPEASSAAILSADLLGLAALVFFFRKRVRA